MLEKFNHLAEAAATHASRREFFGRVGRGAMVVAAGLGGLLALRGEAQAARKVRICPEGSHPFCVGYQEGTSCTGDDSQGSCVFDNKSKVCDCIVTKPKGGKPPKDKA